MKCPSCRGTDYRAVITNNLFEDQTVRKRKCAECGHVWFTVELLVPSYAVGWSHDHMRKPVLRTPVQLTVAHVEPKDCVEALQTARRMQGLYTEARKHLTKRKLAEGPDEEP